MLDTLAPSIRKQPTNFDPHPTTPGERLAIFMLYVAGGASFHDISRMVRFSHTTVVRAVQDVSAAIVAEQGHEVVFPRTQEELAAQVGALAPHDCSCGAAAACTPLDACGGLHGMVQTCSIDRLTCPLPRCCHARMSGTQVQ